MQGKTMLCRNVGQCFDKLSLGVFTRQGYVGTVGVKSAESFTHGGVGLHKTAYNMVDTTLKGLAQLAKVVQVPVFRCEV